MEDLETQRKYKSVRMRLEYDWNTNRKRRRKTCSSAGNQISHSVCSIDSRHYCAVVLQYRNRNGENSTGRNFNHRESTGRHERKDPVGDPFSPDTGGSNSGWSTGTGRVSASDIFHNPIAGPFVLGISSGAKMVVALVMVFLLGNTIRVSSGLLILAAFLGAMLSMGFVLLMARKVDSMSMLVVSGVMIGYICSAITELVVTFAEDADIVNLHNWSRGSFPE